MKKSVVKLLILILVVSVIGYIVYGHFFGDVDPTMGYKVALDGTTITVSDPTGAPIGETNANMMGEVDGKTTRIAELKTDTNGSVDFGEYKDQGLTYLSISIDKGVSLIYTVDDGNYVVEASSSRGSMINVYYVMFAAAAILLIWTITLSMRESALKEKQRVLREENAQEKKNLKSQ